MNIIPNIQEKIKKMNNKAIFEVKVVIDGKEHVGKLATNEVKLDNRQKN